MTPNSEISFGHNGTEKHWYRHNTTTNLYNFSARIFLDRLRKLILTKFGRSGWTYYKYRAKRPPELVGTIPKLWKMIENEPICHFPGWESVQMNLIVSVYRLETLPDPKTHPRNSKNSKKRKSENRKIGRLSQNFSRQQYDCGFWQRWVLTSTRRSAQHMLMLDKATPDAVQQGHLLVWVVHII